MNAEMRQRLLPALKELKKRTFRKKPGFYETLAAMGLNGDTVRQWFYRSRTATEVIELVEEKIEQPESLKRNGELPQDAKSMCAWFSMPTAKPQGPREAFGARTVCWPLNYTTARSL